MKMSLPKIISALWGLFEVGILRVVGKLDLIYPQFHTRFMRSLQGHFGGTVIPFQRNIISNQHKHHGKPIKPSHQFGGFNAALYDSAMQRGDLLILPTLEVLNLILRTNMQASVSECFCRLQKKKQNQKCTLEAPLRTCLTLTFPQSLDEISTNPISHNLSPHISQLYRFFQQCEEIGLIHQIIWMPNPMYTYVICNCCPCCCEVLQPFLEQSRKQEIHKRLEFLLSSKLSNSNSQWSKKEIRKMRRRIEFHHRSHLLPRSPIVAKSAFIAVQTDPTDCIHCGDCVNHCYFEARTIIDNRLNYDPQKCYGCGLCVSRCPQSVVHLKKRTQIEYPNSRILLNSTRGITHRHPHT